jgi:hypothetical protein
VPPKIAGSNPLGHPLFCSKARRMIEARHSHRAFRYGRRQGRLPNTSRQYSDALKALYLILLRHWP